jgi:hypothetical protein
MSRLDFSLFRISLFAFIGILLAVSSTLFVLHTRNQHHQQEFQTSITQLRAIRSSYSDLIEQEKIYREYARRYNALIQKGIIGAENRLSWIESLQSISNDLQLPELNYTISPQTAFPEEALDFAFPSIYVSHSRMEWVTQIYHEGDLLSLLGGIQYRSSGMPLIESCDIDFSRPAGRSGENSVFPSARLTTQCTLDWIQISQERPENYDEP